MTHFFRLSIFFFLSITVASCNLEHTSQQKNLTHNGFPVEDPTFVKTKDTVSTRGPHSITRSILMDRNGILWFATWQGIMRYDARLDDSAGQVNLFTNITLQNGLKHFHIISMLEDKAGNLWFGTISGGVYRYNGKTFTYFSTKDGLIDNSVMCIMEDRDGDIWLGTSNGISRYRPSGSVREGKAFTNYTKNNGLSSNIISAITQDRAGRIWVATQSGVNYYEPKVLPYSEAVSLNSPEKLFANFPDEKGLSFSSARSIIEDKKGNIWIGSQDGLCRYKPGTPYNEKQQTVLRTTYVSNIFEDKKGNLWLSGGEPNSNKMTLTKYDGASFTTITSEVQVFGIAEDKTGKIWFGTMNATRRYDPFSSTNKEERLFTDFLD